MSEVTRLFVYYDPADGAIRQVGQAHAPGGLLGAHVAETLQFSDLNDIKPRHRVDLASLVPVGERKAPLCGLIEWTDEEWRLRNIPSLEFLRGSRQVDLLKSDRIYPMPADRPKAAALNAALKKYRSKLRNLGQYKTAEEWLANWPVCPLLISKR